MYSLDFLLEIIQTSFGKVIKRKANHYNIVLLPDFKLVYRVATLLGDYGHSTDLLAKLL